MYTSGSSTIFVSRRSCVYPKITLDCIFSFRKWIKTASKGNKIYKYVIILCVALCCLSFNIIGVQARLLNEINMVYVILVRSVYKWPQEAHKDAECCVSLAADSSRVLLTPHQQYIVNYGRTSSPTLQLAVIGRMWRNGRAFAYRTGDCRPRCTDQIAKSGTYVIP